MRNKRKKGKTMVNRIITQIDYAKEKLDHLISLYGLADKKVMEQSKKLDELIIKYYSVKRAWIM